MVGDRSLEPPLLPPELKRKIFEAAARSPPSSAPTLILVASRVKTWVEPLLYETIYCILPDYFLAEPRLARIPGHPIFHWTFLQSLERDAPVSSSPPPHFFLGILGGFPETSVLANCSQLEDLHIESRHLQNLLPTISSLPLKRLSCTLGKLFPSPSQIEFTHQLCSRLTHLEHLGSRDPVSPEFWAGLARIPHLTHLAFTTRGFIPLFFGFLDECRSLPVLVLRTSARNLDIHVKLAEDPRFVTMKSPESTRSWKIGCTYGC